MGAIDNDQDKLTKATRSILQFVRWIIYKKRGRRFLLEKIFKKALASGKENDLKAALLKQQKFNISSNLLTVYINEAKRALSQAMSNAYIENQLNDAILSGSPELLESAINLAQTTANCEALPHLLEAKRALQEIKEAETIMDTLSMELEAADTVPRLVSSIDRLENLIRSATKMGLGDSHLVHDAKLRMQKVSALIQLRDKMRFSVEICSPSKMKSAMDERQRMVKVYGPTLCAAEAEAIANMNRMLFYEKHFYDTALSVDAEDSTPTNAQTQESPLDEDSDVRLPPYARTQLEIMRNAKTLDEFHEAIGNLAVLVPNDSKRKMYIRVFKWVVAFAFWCFEKTPEEEAAHEMHVKHLAHATEEKAPTTPSAFIRPVGLASIVSQGFSFGGGGPLPQKKK